MTKLIGLKGLGKPRKTKNPSLISQRGKQRKPISLSGEKPVGGVNITAGMGRGGLIEVTLSGMTDDITITFRITDEEARKLIRVLEDRVKQAKR